jgi:peptidoglycan/xylan/chitin deacetylase (PgdA/CDA1 family)
VTSAAAEATVRGGQRPDARAVMLAFDDALASLWLVVAPLLRRYGLRAVTYAIPGRIAEADRVRRTLDDGPVDPDADRAANPFVTWPELAALSASGVVDVQSHTWSHSMIFCGDRVVDAVGPHYQLDHFLNRPRLDADGPLRFLDAGRVGHPLFARRSRMSDARRFLPDEAAMAEVAAWVQGQGGARFFDREMWRTELLARFPAPMPGRWESDADRTAAIEQELVRARDALESRLGSRVRHVCLPWGISGRQTRALLERLDVSTAFANRLRGRMAVAARDDPFFLKRLHSRFVFSLPGTGRRIFAFGGR